MQQVSTALQTVLDSGINANPQSPTRDIEEVYEFYAADYDPPTTGFDPADAVERFASTNLTWNGLAYRREAEKSRGGDVTRFMSKSFNSCSVRFSNVDRYLAEWVTSTDIEGMRMVIRIISRSVTDSSIVVMVAKVDKPVEFDRINAVISGKQDLGNLELEVPEEVFTPDDPEGRTPDDPLYEGIRFVPLGGSFERTREEVRTTRRWYMPLLSSTKTVTVHYSDQWSSVSGTPYGTPRPSVFGRCQMELIPITFADIGGAAKGLWYASTGEIFNIINIRNVEDPNRQPNNITVHKGEPGGTGTNATPDQQFPNAGLFSNSAYIGAGIPYGDAESVEDPVTVVAIVVGKIVPLPDGSGDFTLEGWTHSGPIQVRYLLNHPKWGNISEAFINNASIIKSAEICAEPLIDESQREQVPVANTDLPVFGSRFRRYRSTGIIDPLRTGYDLELGGFDTPIGETESDPTGFDETDPPTSFAPITYLRERYTTNFIVRERIKLIDLLYDVVLRSFRGYLVINALGQIEVRVERPADNALLRGSTIVGATQLAVDDVTPWKTGELLLRGKIVIGYPLTTSEVRTVTSATYSTAGNSITLEADATGTITATESGATLSGGSTTVPASGTVTIGGSPAAGDTVTIEIDGAAVTHTLTVADTKETVASMLRYRINADETLRRFVIASYDSGSPFVVTITSKLGLLNVAALASTHSIGEEVIRVMMSFSDAPKNADGTVSDDLKRAGLIRNNIIANSFKWPLGSKHSSINRVEIEFNEASDDFARTRLFVNDTAHQTQIRKKNVLKIDGSAIDNHHQASRVANGALSKNREGAWLGSHETADPNAMLLEEGDLYCVSEASSGVVNQILRLEEGRINSERVTSLVGRKYSTNMFSDTVTPQEIPLPTTLRYTKPADTQFVPMDIPYYRDSDPINVPGFHVATNRVLAEGDWISTRIHSDASGAYVPITERASFRVPMGESLNALTPTTNTHTLDTISTVRVQVSTPGEDNPTYQLQSTTEEKLLAGANKYALGINGRWELGQFQTATLVGGTTDTYDLTLHHRGQHGTENNTSNHDTGDIFVLLTDHDGADTGVQFVPTEYKLLDKEVHLIAQTTNQDLSEAELGAQSFTWTGQILRPLPVAGTNKYRNELNDILLEVIGRSRVASGIYSGLTNPLAEEKEKYLYKLMSDDGLTVLHSFTIEAGLTPNPVFWRTYENGLGGKAGSDNVAESMQTFSGEFMFKWTYLSSSPMDAYIGLVYAGVEPIPSSSVFHFNPVEAVGAYVESDVSTTELANNGDEFLLWVKDGVARYFRNYVNELSEPFYTSLHEVPDVAYKLFKTWAPLAATAEGRLLRKNPEVFISADLQTELYGSVKAPGTLRVQIQQISSIAGLGQVYEELI